MRIDPLDVSKNKIFPPGMRKLNSNLILTEKRRSAMQLRNDS
jgi:hypothetical protein